MRRTGILVASLLVHVLATSAVAAAGSRAVRPAVKAVSVAAVQQGGPVTRKGASTKNENALAGPLLIPLLTLAALAAIGVAASGGGDTSVSPGD